jgi:ATP phosphoribosyltransferase
MSNVLRLAIQKSGRLSEDSLKLIKESGIDISYAGSSLKSTASNFPLEVLFLRDDDIPGYVADGVADIGIVGENVAAEKNKNIKTIERLGFSKCRLSIGVPKNFDYKGSEDLNGMKIATSYPNILSDFFKEKNITASIHEISGSVEIAPGIGLSDAICDIVSSGGTLISNGLKEVEVVYRSEAVLISCPKLNDGKTEVLHDLLFRINAVRRARNTKYIMLNAPNESIDEIISLLPGVKSPSIMPLVKKGWSSLHSVVNENDFWQVIEKLRKAGAEGILVLPIEKIIQ